MYINSIVMCIFQIRELITHFSDDFKAKYSEVPWKKMKEMRNVFAHRYATLNVKTLWQTIIENIPVLKEYCEKILFQLRSQEEANQKLDFSDRKSPKPRL
jgi:uncharacterized protein with HEPN domain